MADYSPMMKQFIQMKRKSPDTILFFRLGDFYEMFYQDAVTVSRELELTLTGRECGREERAPMCGVPYHSAEGYIARLVEKGYKVAICEQLEDPRSTKGLVKRDIVRVVTPGTVLESSMLDEARNNYIACVSCGEGCAGACLADVSTGQLLVMDVPAREAGELSRNLIECLGRYEPREMLLDPPAAGVEPLVAFAKDRLGNAVEYLKQEQCPLGDEAGKVVSGQFGGKSLEELGLSKRPLAVQALAALFVYLRRTQINGLERLTQLEFLDGKETMMLDLTALRNLEITETMRGHEHKGSLLWVLDKTKTVMGKRLLRNWLTQPLMNPAAITLRQNAVEELVNNLPLLDGLTQQLRGIFDLERIMSRVVYGSVNARELRALCAALQRLPGLKGLLAGCEATLLQSLEKEVDGLEDVSRLIDQALVDDPPLVVREGGLIRQGFHPELDQLRVDQDGGKELIATIEAKERERTGIPKLKAGYNRVFGYYLEVTNAHKSKVPPEYIRKQTLTNGERYITPELKELESRIVGAHDRAVALETQLFEKVRGHVAKQLERVQATAQAVAAVDVLASLATVAVRNDYTRPVVDMSGKLYLKDSRHPVVEALLQDTPFVPNDVDMDMADNRTAIITGPNMAGKSTYMRQIAIIVIMAQMGSFVPAAAAQIGIVDGIYTRVGASDDLSAGQSTFMVEMTEVAQILKSATKDSLVVFDEIGRGTSTFDGMSIARAVVEFVHDKRQVGAKTLFATHYHELTVLEQEMSGVRNFNIAVKKKGEDITFLRRIMPGGADDSFGIEVAKLAGVPEKVLRRARQVLKELESGGGPAPRPAAPPREEPLQLTMDTPDSRTLSRLRGLDVNNMTPMECMNVLFELRKMLE